MTRPPGHTLATVVLALLFLGASYGAFVWLDRLESLGVSGHVRTVAGCVGGAFFLALALLPARASPPAP